jgi:hypothetical protein
MKAWVYTSLIGAFVLGGLIPVVFEIVPNPATARVEEPEQAARAELPDDDYRRATVEHKPPSVDLRLELGRKVRTAIHRSPGLGTPRVRVVGAEKDVLEVEHDGCTLLWHERYVGPYLDALRLAGFQWANCGGIVGVVRFEIEPLEVREHKTAPPVVDDGGE